MLRLVRNVYIAESFPQNVVHHEQYSRTKQMANRRRPNSKDEGSDDREEGQRTKAKISMQTLNNLVGLFLPVSSPILCCDFLTVAYVSQRH